MSTDAMPEQSAPATTTMTPSDLHAKLDQLKATATQHYSLKNYEAAAEAYSEAAELQDEVNGEMSPDNADLLYLYGRCLYHVAVSKSDVLGGKVASSEEPKRKKRKVAPAADAGDSVIGDALKDGEQKMAEDIVEAVVEDKDGMKKEETVQPRSKPYFQITGDENFTDDEDDEGEEAANEDAAEGEAEAEEEEDDFTIAYEILDMARVLLGKKLATHQASKSAPESAEARQLQERLADTHDLQAEISLENERFKDAINDTRESLRLKMDLYPADSSLLAEAHFKLSLALEFASVTSTGEEGTEQKVDEELRKEAASEMELAIASCNLRIEKEKEKAALSSSPEQAKSITDVQEMVGEMQQRLVDLRNPAVNLSGVTGAGGAQDALQGVLGGLLGESKAEQQKRLAEATKGANDLTGLVKKGKKAKVEAAGVNGGASNGKRKAEEEGVEGSGSGKKAKVEDAEET